MDDLVMPAVHAVGGPSRGTAQCVPLRVAWGALAWEPLAASGKAILSPMIRIRWKRWSIFPLGESQLDPYPSSDQIRFPFGAVRLSRKPALK